MINKITGGITNTNNHFKINLQINGGDTQIRVYDNNTQIAIDKLIIINEALNKISLESKSDAQFYLNELILLFKLVYLDFIPNNGTYQMIHNINILTIYIISCSKHFNENEAIQLLNCDRFIKELNSDCDNNIMQININNTYIDELQELISVDIVIATRKLRTLFNEYVKIIESKKNKIQSTYLELIEQAQKYILNE